MKAVLPNISRLLKHLRRWQKAVWIVALLAAASTLALCTVVLGSGVEAVGWFDPDTRIILLYAILILAGLPVLFGLGGLVYSLVMIHKPSEEYFARAVWNHDDTIRDRILDAIQLLKRKRTGESEALRFAALQKIDSETAKLDARGYIEWKWLNKSVRFSGVLLGISLLIVILSGRSLTDAAHRLTHPGQVFIKPGTVLLQLGLADTTTIVQGDPLELAVTWKHSRPESVQFLLDQGSGIEKVLVATRDSLDTTRFTAILPHTERNMKVFARAKEVTSDTSVIRVIPRPRIARLEVKIQPPAYTGLNRRHLPEGVGDISALPGSRVEVNLESNRPLREARLVTADMSERLDSTWLTVEERIAEGGFQVRRNGAWWINLVAEDGVEGEEPLTWGILLEEDYPPQIEIRMPDEGFEIPENLHAPLVVVADDDYGISRGVLRFRVYNEILDPDSVGEEAFSAIELNGKLEGANRWVVQTLWDLENLSLIPSEEVHYFIEVWDNDAWQGPKRARSELRRLIFPSLKELFTETSEKERQITSDVTTMIREAETVREKFEETLERLRSNPSELNWEENQSLQQSLEKQDDLMNQVQQINEKLDEMRQTFSEHNMVNPELMEKYQQLQELLEQMKTPELEAAMEKLREAMENQDPEKIREALEQLAMDQESFIRSLDRTLNILKQLQAERRMDELAKRAEELAEREQQLADRLEQTDSPDFPHETLRQEKIEKDFRELMEELESFEEEQSESNPQLADSLGRLREDMESKQMDERLNETGEQLQQQNLAQARPGSKRNASDLQQMAARMRNMQQQMVQQAKEELLAEMDRILAELLLVSRRQETLSIESSSLGIASPRYRELAARQSGVIQSLDVAAASVTELTKETFFLGAQILSHLAQARTGMENSIERYTNRRPLDVTGEQRRAMAEIHRSLQQLDNARNSMMGSSSSTGYQEMMEALQKMASQQQSLNQCSSDMPTPFPKPGGQSPGGDMMSRLAAQQRAMAEAMRSLERQSRSMKEILGSLDGIGDSMEDVANDLEDLNVTERTKRLQQRILQRLLDSQRSLQEREFSQERISRVGETFTRVSPGAVSPETGDMLRERMLRALESDYSAAWRNVIRDYFRALEKDSKQESSVSNP